MRGYLGGLVSTILIIASSAWASGKIGEIHEYCGDAIAVVIGSPVSFSAKEPSAELKVEQWIKEPPVSTQPASQPSTLRLSGGPGTFTGQTFDKLAQKGRFLVFVFPGGRTGDGRLGSIIEIDEQGKLPASLFLQCLDPQPKTADDLVGQIKRVLSKEYQTELTKLLGDRDAKDPQRAEAARHLGALCARDAWSNLETEAAKPGRDEESATARESLLALFRIDPVKTTPICLNIVQASRHDYQVSTAAWLLMRRPSDDPKALDILLKAAHNWKLEARYPADHPLPDLIQAIAAMGKSAPEVEVLVMRSLERGSGNVLVAAMYAAGSFKMRRAVPFIYKHLTSEDKTVDVRGSASIALAALVGEDFMPYSVNRQVTEDEARQSAADAFPDWRSAFSKAPAIECFRGDRVVCASDNGQTIYVLVAWQQQPNQAQPYRKAVLLYSTVAAATQPTGRSSIPAIQHIK